MREFCIRIGKLEIFFQSEKELIIEPELQSFLMQRKSAPDVNVYVRWNYEAVRKPISQMTGQDLMQKYYQEGEMRFCETKGGAKGPVSLVCYDAKYQVLECVINDRDFEQKIYTLGWILRLLPMRELFQNYGVLFFHGTQIAIGNRGILFAAPSGTGKTTQAALWEKHEQAKILCGDRTLVRRHGKRWKCYSYPVDGSSPVRSREETDLKAVVFLTQAQENHVERLKPTDGVIKLMRQLIIDTWSADARQKGVESLLELQQSIPVYQLFCTPDQQAVEVLKKQLIEDGMI